MMRRLVLEWLGLCGWLVEQAEALVERDEKERDSWKGVYENYRDDAEESIARAEGAARDFARVLGVIAQDEQGARLAARAVLARHPSFSGEEGTEASAGERR